MTFGTIYDIINRIKLSGGNMEIAIIADDSKKELMAEFCIAYCGILSKHSLCATATTGKYISDSKKSEISYEYTKFQIKICKLLQKIPSKSNEGIFIIKILFHQRKVLYIEQYSPKTWFSFSIILLPF